jgi:hypothetical protein
LGPERLGAELVWGWMRLAVGSKVFKEIELELVEEDVVNKKKMYIKSTLIYLGIPKQQLLLPRISFLIILLCKVN